MRTLATLFILVVLTLIPAQAQDTTLLQNTAAHFANAEAYSFSLNMTIKDKDNGQDREISLKTDLVLQGEENFYTHITTPQETVEIISNGTNRWVHLVDEKRFLETPAPGHRSELVARLAAGPMLQGTLWLADLLHNNPQLIDKASSIEALESSDYTAFQLTYPKFILDLYLQKEAPHLPHHYTIKPVEGQSPIDYTLDFQFSEWNMQPNIPENRFNFSPAADVAKIERPQAMPDSSLGKAAPDLTLPLMDGGEITISNFKGKKVVLLDFWATWCGPCRMAMPVIADIAEEYKDQDVAVYAVNIQEPEETIKRFLTQLELDLDVALDNGRAATLYKAQSIPRTVLIGKDGTIQKIHEGYTPYLKRQLSNEIDALLKGETLAD